MLHVRPTPPHSALERCASRASTLSYNKDFCRICHCDADSDANLISPCHCSGSLRFVHQSCLQQWIKSSDIKCCELCKFAFVMQTKTKPFSMWEKLDMASSERRKLLCSVAFHVVALTCVVWSLYVLIERTTEEVRSGSLEWPFWTKLIVVAIGVTGGVVFMYVQCKVYVQLFKRWRAYNRVIYVQNVPSKSTIVDVDAVRSQLPMNDVCSAQNHGRSSIDSVHWPLAGSNSQSRRTSDEQRQLETAHWSLTSSTSQSCRKSDERRQSAAADWSTTSHSADESKRRFNDIHGRVHVTIERSRSSSPMLPSGEFTAEKQLPASAPDGVRSAISSEDLHGSEFKYKHPSRMSRTEPAASDGGFPVFSQG